MVTIVDIVPDVLFPKNKTKNYNWLFSPQNLGKGKVGVEMGKIFCFIANHRIHKIPSVIN